MCTQRRGLRGARGTAGGRRVAAGRGRRRRRGRPGQHLWLRRVREEGLDRHTARGGRAQEWPAGPVPWWPWVAWPALRRPTRAGPAGGRRGARFRRLRRHFGAPRSASSPGTATSPTRPSTVVGCCRSSPTRRLAVGGRPMHVPGHAKPADLPEGVAPAVGAAHAAPPPRRQPGGAAQARLRLRPPLRVLRHPSFRGSFLSRPPADVLGEARWLAESGVREIVLVSENSTSYGKDLGDLRLLEGLLPHWPPPGHRPSPGQLSSARRDAPFPHRGADRHIGRGRRISICPFSTPAVRCCAACAVSGTLSAFSSCFRLIRDPLRPGGGQVQRDRRLPGGDRGRRRRARALPGGRSTRCGRHLRLFRRGRHRGPDPAGQVAGPRRPGPRRYASPPWPRSSPPSVPRSVSGRWCRCWSSPSGPTARSWVGPPTRRRRSTASLPSDPPRRTGCGAEVIDRALDRRCGRRGHHRGPGHRQFGRRPPRRAVHADRGPG